MKKIKYLVAVVAAVMMTGCKDFFEPESPSSIAGEFIYSSPEKIENAMHGVYRIFGENNSYRNRLVCGYQGMNTDIEFNNKTGDDDLAISAYNMNTTNGRVGQNNGGIWSYLNIGVERCNNIIEGIEDYGDLENPKIRYYLGEALTLRAFFYNEMVKLWGDVPARFGSVTKNPGGLETAKTDRNVIYEQLRVDLKRAAEMLPWSAECPDSIKAKTTQRPSKAFALALLARIDLNYAGYSLRPDFIQRGGGAPYSVQLNLKDQEARRALYAEAMNACGQIIEKEDFKFKKNFADIFHTICEDNHNYDETEVIFGIPFAVNRGQFINYNCINVKDVSNALRNYGGGSTNACQRVIPTLYFDYDKADKRRDVTIATWLWSTATPSGWSPDRMQQTFPGYTTKPLYQDMKDLKNFSLGKFRVEWMAGMFNSTGDDGVDFPVIRYTDVMLMFCEASLGGITGDVPQYAGSVNAQAQFDLVRTRAGLESKPLNMENLMDERKFEFCGEYIRKYDLQRWGLLKTKLVETRARLDAMVMRTGEFEQLSDSVWYKYKRIPADEAAAHYLYQGSGAVADAAYIIDPDSVWGLQLGETKRPEKYKTSNGWRSKSIIDEYTFSEFDKEGKPNFLLYRDADLIDKRQLWPIFASDVAISNGTLWNDYDY